MKFGQAKIFSNYKEQNKTSTHTHTYIDARKNNKKKKLLTGEHFL